MTITEFSKAANISLASAMRWHRHIYDALDCYNIVKKEDIAMFIAQAGHESSGFSTVIESLNYSPKGLLSTFGSRITERQADTLGRTSKHPANQPAIAELVYGNRMGNIFDGDGWKFRGRGLLQLTGRHNYEKCSEILNIDLIKEPELLCTEKYAALSSSWFYSSRGCLNCTGDIRTITKIINGGNKGIADRTIRYQNAIEILNNVIF